MFTHDTTMFSGEYLGNFQSYDVSEPSSYLLVSPPPLTQADKLIYYELDSVINSSGSSDSYGSTSCTTQMPSFIQRSVSSHSLQKNGFCPPINSSGINQYLDSDAGHVRRVYSTGDLNVNRNNNVMQQGHERSESPLSNESSSRIIEGMMSKACRYSPEEKKEKIERYRSKRTQRNFNKKIKYECRKTLADSRPRIRGRFAKNGYDQVEWGPLSCEEDGDNWVNFIDT